MLLPSTPMSGPSAITHEISANGLLHQAAQVRGRKRDHNTTVVFFFVSWEAAAHHTKPAWALGVWRGS
ncbi:MAG: hypothetical protein ACXVCX_15140 [Ktedonobacterales bacterium]